MLQKIRSMGKESKFSALSVLFLVSVLPLHLVHGLTVTMLMGASADLQMHDHHHMAGSGSSLMQLLMIALFIINLISMYFAVRQLALAWKKRGSGTFHTYLCSAVSIGVLAMGVYTVLSL
ncbi:hypothetical protein VK70_09665 [Paenibacillus durus ATCC 35681]|uniref:Uncharacterized protein n=2 Tax=Paenibacillus durus TaxID=44251 RepID=A0A0F7FA06_PAEDU|nr:hypothetical protein VK70_09665 [Paenibacillus durus ATCC 35681]